MARAGWCRECGTWVWVDDEGACQHGHDADCVDGIHESEPAVSGFGEGEMPAELHRFNWGAFFLMPLWGVVFGSSAVLAWWLFGLIAEFGISSLVVGAGGTSAFAGALAVAYVVGSAIRLWVGMNANAWLWKRERMRLAVITDSRPRFSVTRFLAGQRRWLIAGGVLTLVSMAGLGLLGFSSDPSMVEARAQLEITSDRIVVDMVWTLAEVILAVWLAAKVRRERADVREA